MENNMNNIPQKPAEQSGVGPVIGSIIVIIVVIIGGIYFWANKIAKNEQPTDTNNQTATTSINEDSTEDIIDLNQLDIPEEDMGELENSIKNL